MDLLTSTRDTAKKKEVNSFLKTCAPDDWESVRTAVMRRQVNPVGEMLKEEIHR